MTTKYISLRRTMRRFFIFQKGDNMEVKINKEIRSYTESIFLGLNLRQCIFSVLAMGAAVGVYFGLKGTLGTETVSWLCIVAAAPFAALGFIKYNGMTAEQFAWAWLKSEVIFPKRYTCISNNLYYEALKPQLKEVFDDV